MISGIYHCQCVLNALQEVGLERGRIISVSSQFFSTLNICAKTPEGTHFNMPMTAEIPTCSRGFTPAVPIRL